MTDQPPASPPGPTPAAPKVEVPAKTPEEMISPALKSFLEGHLKAGSTVTVEMGKTSFTGRVFRLMLHEGWIAVEHVDGRRRAFFVYEPGSISGSDGSKIPFGTAAH